MHIPHLAFIAIVSASLISKKAFGFIDEIVRSEYYAARRSVHHMKLLSEKLASWKDKEESSKYDKIVEQMEIIYTELDDWEDFTKDWINNPIRIRYRDLFDQLAREVHATVDKESIGKAIRLLFALIHQEDTQQFELEQEEQRKEIENHGILVEIDLLLRGFCYIAESKLELKLIKKDEESYMPPTMVKFVMKFTLLLFAIAVLWVFNVEPERPIIY